MAIQIPGRCGSTGDFFVSGVRSVFLWKTDLTPTFQMAGNTLDASADNSEDGAWFFWLALHGATHP